MDTWVIMLSGNSNLVLNDTGSSLLTVFDTDLVALGIPSIYAGYGPQISINTAAGVVSRQSITVEVQLCSFSVTLCLTGFSRTVLLLYQIKASTNSQETGWGNSFTSQ